MSESKRGGSLQSLPAMSLSEGGKSILWFHATINIPKRDGMVCMVDQTLEISGGQIGQVTLKPPDGCVFASKRQPIASVVYENGMYVTSINHNCKGTSFISGIGWQVPDDVTTLLDVQAEWTSTFTTSESLRYESLSSIVYILLK